MERRTALGIAGGTTLAVAAVVAAIGVNVGLMSDRGGDDSPGTFQPVVAELEQRLDDSATTTPTTAAGAVTDDSTPTTLAPAGTAPVATVPGTAGTAPSGTVPTTRYWDDDDHFDDQGGDRPDVDDRFDDDGHLDDSGRGRGRGGDDDWDD